MWFCPGCGSENEDSFSFCTNCGTKKPVIEKAETPAEDGKGKKTAGKGIIYALAGAVIVLAVVLIVILARGGGNDAGKNASNGKSGKISEETEIAVEDKDKTAEENGKASEEAVETVKEPEEDFRLTTENDMSEGKWEDALLNMEKADYSEEEKDTIEKECRYHLGLEAAENGEWNAAAEYFSDNDFSDSAERYEEAMLHTHSDFDFLNDLEHGMKEFLKTDYSVNDGRLKGLDAMLSLVGDYTADGFYDGNLGDIAEVLIEELELQQDACMRYADGTVWVRMYQAYIWQSRIYCCEFFTELYEDYGFMTDNKQFVSNVVNGKETLENQLNIIKLFDESFTENRSAKGSSGWYDSKHQFIRYTNDTGVYLPSVTFMFTMYDKNGKQSEYDEVTMELPLKERVNIVFAANSNISKSWDWDWYINF